ncbi:MAG: response regulators consisting of a CheY-like receiver domain and a winged-helix DNA-binding [bacterium]|nr:MAG: response regulators consisting of a CheY-like receiver domain and a winged-helix DNA-binding [bacterium]
MKTILVAVRDESLITVISEVLATVAAEMETEPKPTLEQIEQLMPALVIVDYTEEPEKIDTLFKAVIDNESTSSIPFMFIISEFGKWSEIEDFRLGFDTKVSKDRPKLGIQLRVQAILKKSRKDEGASSKAKDLQQIMQSIIKKSKGSGDDTGSYLTTKPLIQQAKVLVVEDEPLTRDVLQAALEKDYQIVFAYDGSKGYETAIEELPDLIISDYMMPIMDGMQLLHKIRATEELKKIPFLFLTAKSRTEDKIEGLEQGASEYLSKPFSIRELQLRVSRLVEEAQYRRSSAGALQGQLAEVGLPDILHIINNNRKSGELVINSSAARDPVRIYFSEGNVINAAYGKSNGLKAFFRSLSLEQGSFTFETKQCLVKHLIKDRMENLLLEGYRQMDEFEMLRTKFSSGLDAQLRPGTEKAVQSGISNIDAIVLFAVGAHASVQEVLDKVAFTDFEVIESIINLLDVKLITSD